ncbi:hypothetical protein GCM10010331_49580 [Streptomyces xanthochromogenes]|uniref:hypothetical protein n=1 Tax=Streptomyces xanthochromogenes TaxID=67384 RepID=UPI00167BBD84|nr:hypothetical protein [Streptomyces xanthochromogenes]GHB55806.1 hypothetical protein GCM10010331_49580 [Streptomyces xanthochromogenes]
MQKIPTMFARNPEDRRYVLPAVTPGCEWVLAGEGVATRKYDGTCVMYDGVTWWARREVKPGKTPPPTFQAISTDEITGRTVGWEQVEQSSFAKFHAEAIANVERLREDVPPFRPGTYELVGPKINGNPEGEPHHWLIAHAEADVVSLPGRSFDDLRTIVLQLAEVDGSEGLVFHHADGRMAKIKARDFPKSL